MKRKKSYLFWIAWKQNKERAVYNLPATLSKKEIDRVLENWCGLFSAFKNADSVRYGWEEIEIPKRRELKKRWTELCKRRNKINDEWGIAYQMLLAKTPQRGSPIMDI